MIRRAVNRLMWLGRATSTVVGLAILFALAIGVTNSALAHTNVDNKLFHLDHNNNVATALTKLTGTLSGAVLKLDNNGTGPALSLEANSGRAPLVVNAGAGKATNLNADRLDDRDASSFANGVNGKATDSELLDGQDSSTFQQRVSGVCPEGSSIRSIGADGTTLDCEQDDEGDGGEAQVNNLRTELGTNDGASNEVDDPVSFSQVKHIDSNILSRNADQLDGLDSALYQRRVSFPCSSNFYMRAIDANGNPICAPDDAPALRSELGSNTDIAPNQLSDPVSFGKIKNIPSDIVLRNAESLDGMDSISFQRRVASACSSGSSIRAIDVDGTVSCETDDDSGSAQVSTLRNELGTNDGTPNQSNDPVSFNKVKDIPADVVNRNADTLDGLNSTEFQSSNAAAGGDLTGNYPVPQIANGAVSADEMATLPAVRARNSNLTVNDNTHTPLQLTFEDFDQVGAGQTFGTEIHSAANTGVFRAPRAGIYEVQVEVIWGASSHGATGTGERSVILRKNFGTCGSGSFDEMDVQYADPGERLATDVSMLVDMNPGDSVILCGYHNSGESLNVDFVFASMHYVSAL